MSASWRPLKLASSNDDIPPLLISSNFFRSSYEISLTDLVHVWTESLEKRAIERRSEDEETSINPVGDPEQLAILLEKLEHGLSGAPGTSLSLSSHQGRVRSEPNRLVLHIQATLPKPLQPLEWPVRLELGAQSAIASSLSIPLIKAHKARAEEVDDLITRLKDKDHVIEKLLDKMESSGTDLSRVFAGAMGRNGKPLPRHQADTRIKGLKPFDLSSWKLQPRKEETEAITADEIKSLLGNTFNDGNEFRLERKSTSENVPDWDYWWENMKSISLNALTLSSVARKATEKKISAGHKAPSTEDSDFQIQATPPRLEERALSRTPQKPTSKIEKRQKIVEDSTEEAELDDISSQSTVIPDSLPLNKSKRVGKIGGVRPKNAAKITDAEPDKSLGQEHLTAVGDETDTEDESVVRSKAIPAEEYNANKPRGDLPLKSDGFIEQPKRKKSNLGRIGGQKKQVEQVAKDKAANDGQDLPEKTGRPEEAVAVNAADEKSSNSPKDDDHNDRSLSSIPDHKNESSNVVTARRKSPMPESEETELERADRKRSEMKRELAEKAMAPAKKTRKF